MNMDTFLKFFKKHIYHKNINLLKGDLAKLLKHCKIFYYVEQLLNILEKLIAVLRNRLVYSNNKEQDINNKIIT